MSRLDWAGLRARHYGEVGPGIFVNHASWGVSPAASAQAMADFALRRGRVQGIAFDEFGRILDRARAAIGTLLGVPGSQVCLAPNTSYGINLAAQLVRQTRSGGRIVVSAGEFPTNVLPWLPLRDEGFELDLVALREGGLLDEDALVERLEQGGVAVLAVSAVQFASGVVADLERLGAACRRAGVWFVVDAIQGAGVVPLRPAEWGVHVLASGGQKWLCGPWGSGFCWVDPQVYDRLDPMTVSWLGVEGGTQFSTRDGYALDWLPDARRYEPATLGTQDYLGLAEAVEVLLEIGIEAVRARIHALQDPVLAWAERHTDVRVVTPTDEARRAGIVALEMPDPEATLAALEGRGVQAAVREGWVRIAPHWWLSEAEMAEVVRALEQGRTAAG